MSVIADLPDIRPSLLLDFANSGRVDPRISLERASTATYYGPDGLLRTAANNVPRVDYDPLTGKCLGLLIEETRTNLILQSNNFSNALWTKSAPITVTQESDDWWDIAHNGTGNYAGIYQTGRPNTNKYAAFSFDIRPGSLNSASMFLGFNGTADAARVSFDFAAGTSAIASIVGIITSAMVTHSLKNMGDFWRVTMSLDASSASITPTSNVCYLYTGAVVSAQVAGNIKARRAQLESARFSTPYIPTDASTVTRAAEVLTTPLDNSADVTIAIAWEEVGSKTGFLWQMDAAGSGATRLRLAYSAANDLQAILTTANTPSTVTVAGPANISAGLNAVAVAFSSSSITWGRNGVGGAAVNSRAALPATTILRLGSSQGGTSQPNFRLKRLAVYRRALTQAQLQRLTTL